MTPLPRLTNCIGSAHERQFQQRRLLFCRNLRKAPSKSKLDTRSATAPFQPLRFQPSARKYDVHQPEPPPAPPRRDRQKLLSSPHATCPMTVIGHPFLLLMLVFCLRATPSMLCNARENETFGAPWASGNRAARGNPHKMEMSSLGRAMGSGRALSTEMNRLP